MATVEAMSSPLSPDRLDQFAQRLAQRTGAVARQAAPAVPATQRRPVPTGGEQQRGQPQAQGVFQEAEQLLQKDQQREQERQRSREGFRVDWTAPLRRTAAVQEAAPAQTQQAQPESPFVAPIPAPTEEEPEAKIQARLAEREKMLLPELEAQMRPEIEAEIRRQLEEERAREEEAKKRTPREQVTELARKNPEAIAAMLSEWIGGEEGTQHPRKPAIPTIKTIQQEADERAKQTLEPIIRRELQEEFDEERERLIWETEERVRQELAEEDERRRFDQQQRSLPSRVRRGVGQRAKGAAEAVKRAIPRREPPPTAEAEVEEPEDLLQEPDEDLPRLRPARPASPRSSWADTGRRDALAQETLERIRAGATRDLAPARRAAEEPTVNLSLPEGVDERDIPSFLRRRTRAPEPPPPPAAPPEAAPSADDLLASFNELSRDLDVSAEDVGRAFLPPRRKAT